MICLRCGRNPNTGIGSPFGCAKIGVRPQSSIFVFGLPEIDEDNCDVIVIAQGAKARIAEELGAAIATFSAKNLFPDFPGFATANSVEMSWHLRSAKEYFEEGDKFYLKKRYDSALVAYGKAEKLDPQMANDVSAARDRCYIAMGKPELAAKGD